MKLLHKQIISVQGLNILYDVLNIEPTMGLQYFHPPSSQPTIQQQQPQQHQQQQLQQHGTVTYSHPTGQPPALYTYSGGHPGPSPTRSPQTSREEPSKHIQQGHGNYLQQSQPISRGYAMLHHPMEVSPYYLLSK